MKRYKLTDQNMQTYNNFQWELGKEYSTSGKGDLCGPGWLHCYSHPLLAALLNSLHADFKNPRLFLCEATGNHKYDKGLKEGCTTLKLIKEIELPIITLEQRVAFGILCALEVYKEKTFNLWAKNWLNNIDRTNTAAITIARDTYAAVNATYAAANATYAAANATYATNDAANDATKYKINLISIAKECLKY